MIPCRLVDRRKRRGRKVFQGTLPIDLLLAVLLAVLGVANTTKHIFVDGFDLQDHRLSYGSLLKSRTVGLEYNSSSQKLHNRVPQTAAEDDQPSKEKVTNYAFSVRGGSRTVTRTAIAVSQPKRRSQIVPIMVSLVIGSFSVLEIIESLHKEVESVVGHAHGMFLLSLIRLTRSVAILQTQTEELAEAVEELTEGKETKAGSSKKSFLSFWKQALLRFVVSRHVAIAACVMASIASIVEVVEDLKPGAHHGAVFLALSELNYQVNRFSHIVDHSNGGKKKSEPKGLLFSFRSIVLGPLLFLAAAAFAAFEVYEDTRPGAHHAVAVLALAELIENLDRSKVLRRKRRFILFGPKMAS